MSKTVTRGPMSGHGAGAYWTTHRKPGCACAFCDALWEKGYYSDGTMIGSVYGANYHLLVDQGYGLVTAGQDKGKWVMGCTKVHGFFDGEGTPLGTNVQGISGQPGFSVTAYNPVEKVQRHKYVFAKTAPEGGCNCSRCGNNNPYAGPNKEDGTYVCYSCR